MNRRVLVLADNLNPWHSLWVRLGQYFHHLPIHYEARTEAGITRDTAGLILDLPRQPDCLVLYRFAPESPLFLELLVALKGRGCRIVADIDDDLWSREAHPTLGKQAWPRERLACLNRVLRLVDLITVSTPELQRLLAVMFPGQAVLVVANTLPHTTPRSSVSRDPAAPLRLGWTGAPWSRPHDLAQLRPLAAWIAKSPNLQLVHLGHNPEQASLAALVGLPEERVETYPVMPHSDYLKQLRFDVGLAPLAPTLFNAFKSDLKLLEYSGAGIPWLASAAFPYCALAQAWGVEQLLCRTPEDFIAGVERLIPFPQWNAVRDHLLQVSQSRSFATGLKCWAEALALG